MIVDPTLVQRILAGVAREQELAAAPLDEVRAIKRDKDSVHYRFMERASDAKKTAERTFEHNASTDHVDGMGDIIKAPGWDLVRMKVGKVPLLWGHSSYTGTMGLVDGAKKNVKLDDGHRALVTTSHVFETEVFQGSEWGKHVATVALLMERGEMPGVSVGFVPKNARPPTPDEIEKNTSLRPWSYIYEEQELLELSVTPIPANPFAQERKAANARAEEALRSLVKEGKLDPIQAELYVKALAAGEEAWLQRAAGKARTVVALETEMPWLRREATQQTPAEAPSGDPADSRVLREELSATREAMVLATTELREARASLSQNSKTSERVTKGAEGGQQDDGPAAIAIAALMSAGTSRESVTDDTAGCPLASAVKAACAAVAKPEHESHASRTGHRPEADRSHAAQEPR